MVKGLRRAVRVFVSLIAFSAYASAANHCALAPMGDTVAKTPSHAHASSHAGCPGHETPGKSDVQCCQKFPTAAIAAVKNLVAFDAFSFANHSYFTAAVHTAEHLRAELHPLELDTGPPFAISFVESVLQRSILAHAPPLFLS